MSQLGIGAMIYQLGGGSEHSSSEYYGKTINAASMKDDHLKIEFSDGTLISIWDDGQSCCESRYMTCDDNPQDLVGGKLQEITVRYDELSGLEYGEHEVAFLKIQTDKSSITIATHNEHNGYYGGFGLRITEYSKGTGQEG